VNNSFEQEHLISYLNRGVDSVPGVNTKVYDCLKRLGCYTVKDILFHFPVRVDRKHILPSADMLLPPNEKVVSKITILSMTQIGRSRNRLKVSGLDHNNMPLSLLFFNKLHPFVFNKLKSSKTIYVYGKLERDSTGSGQIIHPKLYDDISHMDRFDIIYPLTYAITSEQVHTIINKALLVLKNIASEDEWLSKDCIDNHGWSNWFWSLYKIHNPSSAADSEVNSKYRARLAFDELLAHQLMIKKMRSEDSVIKADREARTIVGMLFVKVLSKIGFTLTNGQKTVIEEIIRDQSSSKKMLRLLQGDVGSGKTLVAMAAMLNIVELGKQAAIMAPTDVLANQHFIWFQENLSEFGIRVECLTGKTKNSQRTKILENLANGSIDILIGTHALFQDSVTFKDLELVVIDEQQRFGVQQRLQLTNKGIKCDVLAMSATPIPRTLSLTIYGDMDISILNEKPADRKEINTLTVSANRIDEILELIRTKLAKNDQIYWICPLIEADIDKAIEDENYDINTAATQRFEFLQKIFGSDVALMHGKLKNAEKDEVMTDFVNHKYKILVSTTVIEVGVNVPNATLMVIERADRFGLSQLHQLRGRIGRGDKQSDCVLLFSKDITETGKHRLRAIKNSNDGFYIAEQDLKLRGGGNMFGSQQSGLPSFRSVDVERHFSLFMQAKTYADSIFDACSNVDNQFMILFELYGYKQTKRFVESG
jgi:ATP-dependent DNA helicase RecG